MSDGGDLFDPDYWKQRIDRAVRDVVASDPATGHSPEVLQRHFLAVLAVIMSDPNAPKIRNGSGEVAAELIILVTKALQTFKVTKD